MNWNLIIPVSIECCYGVGLLLLIKFINDFVDNILKRDDVPDIFTKISRYSKNSSQTLAFALLVVPIS